MQATALTISLVGLEACPIRVEVDSGRGPSSFQLVGLPEASVRESRVRVRSALQQIGVDLDEYVITVNLAPADLRKNGGAFDLAIAMAALAALGHIPEASLEGIAFLGELSLTGAIRPVRGVLPALCGAKAQGTTRAIVPRENRKEAACVAGVQVAVASHLTEIVAYFKKGKPLDEVRDVLVFLSEPREEPVDLSEVRGQHAARRALEVAAAGGHNLIMIGPPGSGKTMLARRLPTIMPPMRFEEALEVSAVHSVAGMLPPEQGLVMRRPFRAPHHTVSSAALVGGGDPVRPGEVSLAHHGCLFLDELFEFRRSVLEALRQPVEDGFVTVCRARARVTFPAQTLIVCAMNPCPCGFYGDRTKRCGCGAAKVRTYRAKLSGPLLDRMDLHIQLPPVELARLKLGGGEKTESSARVRERVEKARAMQLERRARGEVVAVKNGDLSLNELERVAKPDEAGEKLLFSAATSMGLSARAYSKVLRVARTIADLDGSTGVLARHVSEAVCYRILDRDAQGVTS